MRDGDVAAGVFLLRGRYPSDVCNYAWRGHSRVVNEQMRELGA